MDCSYVEASIRLVSNAGFMPDGNQQLELLSSVSQIVVVGQMKLKIRQRKNRTDWWLSISIGFSFLKVRNACNHWVLLTRKILISWSWKFAVMWKVFFFLGLYFKCSRVCFYIKYRTTTSFIKNAEKYPGKILDRTRTGT